MKKILIVVLLFALALHVTPAKPAAAAADSSAAELEYIDAQIGLFLPRLDTFQIAHYAQYGRYWQALNTHNTPPVGVDAPNNIDAIPTDGTLSLAAMWSYAALPAELGWAWRVDTYNAPGGPGYVLTVYTSAGGYVWARAINRGVEDWRGYDWQTQ